MDLTSIAVISLFAAGFAGALIGLLVAWRTRFEFGLSAGLIVFGGVALWFAGRCYLEYAAFSHAGANGLWGEVIKIEEIPIGDSGSQTAPLVRFTAPDDSVHTVLGPRASSARVGEHVNVIYDPSAPQNSKIGKIGELRGCAIAMMLFGTFPVSFAVFMLYSALAASAEPRPDRRGLRGSPGRSRGGLSRESAMLRDETAADVNTQTVRQTTRSRIHTTLSMVLYCTMFGAIVWMGLGTEDDLGRRFAQGFAVVAGALFGYALLGLFGRTASSVWAFGVTVLAINFAVWAFALHLLV